MENTNSAASLYSPGRTAQTLGQGKWIFAPHLEYIDNLLLMACKNKIFRLIINMPPRHGKSELISKYFPYWYLCNNPGKRIILTSYEARFAASWGRKVCDLITEHGKEYFDLELHPKVRSSGNFEIKDTGGGMDCAGAGGAITGKGADLLIIDDPVKNFSSASSPLIRDKTWDWFLSTAYTRLEPQGIIIIIMTRWHEDDLCGRIISSPANNILVPVLTANGIELIPASLFYQGLTETGMQNLEVHDVKIHEAGKQDTEIGEAEKAGESSESAYYGEDEKEDWVLACLPALATECDLLGREPGEPLWSYRFPAKKLLRMKRTLGSYIFSALYQQSPSPAEGGIFNRRHFRYFTENDTCYYLMGDTKITYRKADCMILASTDLAVTSKQTSDYTVIMIFALTPKNQLLVIDVIRLRVDGSEHLNILKNVCSRWEPKAIGIENVQYQGTLIQLALNEGLAIKSLKADRDKVYRARGISTLVESGRVYFRSGSPWLVDFEDEVLRFPNGRYDDQVDAFAYAGMMINGYTNALPGGAARRSETREIAKGFM